MPALALEVGLEAKLRLARLAARLTRLSTPFEYHFDSKAFKVGRTLGGEVMVIMASKSMDGRTNCECGSHENMHSHQAIM